MTARKAAARYRVEVLFALATLIVLCAAAYFLFPWLLGRSYLGWYLDAGPFIGIATASFAAAWGRLDQNIGLVSAHPLDYIGACAQVVGLPLTVLGEHVTRRTPLWDRVLVSPLAIAFAVAALGWLLLIAPLQYFVYLICGAPSRIALASDRRVFARFAGVALETRTQPETQEAPEGWGDASMKNRPVSLAAAFSAGLFFLLGEIPVVSEFVKAWG